MITTRPRANAKTVTVLTSDEAVLVPSWFPSTLAEFRRWAANADNGLPEKTRIDYYKGEVWIDMGFEQAFTHGAVKTEFAVVRGLVKRKRLGRYFANGVLVTNVTADWSGNPDGTFISDEAVRAGRVAYAKAKRGGVTEVVGTPDMVLEVVSPSSVHKDTVRLRGGVLGGRHPRILAGRCSRRSAGVPHPEARAEGIHRNASAGRLALVERLRQVVQADPGHRPGVHVACPVAGSSGGCVYNKRYRCEVPMTEGEWLRCVAPRELLRFMETRAASRKATLYSVACCRWYWHLFSGLSRQAVDAAEQYVDGKTDLDTLHRISSRMVRGDYPVDDSTSSLTHRAAMHAAFGLFESAWVTAQQSAEFLQAAVAVEHGINLHDERSNPVSNPAVYQQVALIRDIFGNPFHDVIVDPQWRTAAAVGLAQSMYDARDFAAMPVLADALEEAGCDNADILAHCRGPGPHVRGCWVVDLVLGKT